MGASDDHLEKTPADGRLSGWETVGGMTLKDRWQAFAAAWSIESFPLPPHPDHAHEVHSLFEIAVQNLFADPETFCATVALLPPHILCRVTRHACVYAPQVFSPHVLVDAFAEESENVEAGEESQSIPFFELVAGNSGELNYIGDGKTSKPLRRYLEAYEEAVKASETADSWEDTPPEQPAGLLTYIQPSLNPLVYLHISDVPLVRFHLWLHLLPRTLVRLSLLALPYVKEGLSSITQTEISRTLKRLSKQLPLLDLLDISHNSWVDLREQVQHVEWNTAWPNLHTLIVRGVIASEDSAQMREHRDRTPNGVLLYDPERADSHQRVPAGVIAHWKEINNKRRLGSCIRLAY